MTTAGRSSMPQTRWFFIASLVIAIVIVHAPSLRAPFLFDAVGAVVNNATIRHLWSLDVLRPPADGSTTTGRPLVNLSFAINYAISGDNVWSYHALNLAFHILAALVLMGVVRRTFLTPALRERFGW